MSSVRFRVAIADVKIRPVVTCSKCNTMAESDTIKLITGVVPYDCLFEEISLRAKHEFVHPPIGWASYGNGTYKCQDCKT